MKGSRRRVFRPKHIGPIGKAKLTIQVGLH